MLLVPSIKRAYGLRTSNPYSISCLPCKHVFVSIKTFFAIRPYQGVTCPDVVRWVNGKFSYERPGTLGSPLGYILLPPAAS